MYVKNGKGNTDPDHFLFRGESPITRINQLHILDYAIRRRHDTCRGNRYFPVAVKFVLPLMSILSFMTKPPLFYSIPC